MSKVSKATATTRWTLPGLMDAATQELDGYSIEMESWSVDMDFAFAYKGLPDDQCQAHHVGYVIKGRLTVQTADGEEVFEAGDAYVLKPGHVPAVSAGSEFVTFTSTEESNAMAPVVQENMTRYMREQGIQLPG